MTTILVVEDDPHIQTLLDTVLSEIGYKVLTSSPDLIHYVRIYIGHLREKLETTPDSPPYIITEPGIGYRFN
jgi:DNA-binding response OmpR family regulator